jgi:hypothetical protein
MKFYLLNSNFSTDIPLILYTIFNIYQYINIYRYIDLIKNLNCYRLLVQQLKEEVL